MAEQRLNVSVENGKYTVIMEADGRLHALRYGGPWQDLCGNTLVYFLAAELEAIVEVDGAALVGRHDAYP